MLEQLHTEFIKKTMIDQENIFQHQVRELHRLYSVERRLMNELKTEFKQISLGGSKTGLDINDSDYVYSRMESIRVDQSLGEHSESCSTEILKMPKGFDLERRAEQEDDMSTGVSATDEERKRPSTDTPWKSGGTNIDAKFRDIELTLSIGGSSGRKRLEESHKSLKLDNLREVQSSSIIKGEEFSDSSITPKAGSTKNNEKGKQNHWVFQDLSLRRT